jgi:hypothetical protein
MEAVDLVRLDVDKESSASRALRVLTAAVVSDEMSRGKRHRRRSCPEVRFAGTRLR